MRPQILNHYFKSLSSFPGIGTQREKSIEKNIGPYPIDLLFHLPYALETRYEHTLLSKCVPGTKVTISLEIIDIQKKPQYTTVWASDGQESLALTYFNANSHWLKSFYNRSKKLISGKIDVFSGYKQIVHPDFVGSPHMKENGLAVSRSIDLLTSLANLDIVLSFKIFSKLYQRSLNGYPMTLCLDINGPRF